MEDTSSSRPTVDSKPCLSVPAQARFLVAVLLMQAFLFLSAHYRWFWFNHEKGYTVFIALAATALLLLLLSGSLLMSRFFRTKPQFGLRTLLLIVLAISVPCGWLAREVHFAQRQGELVAAVKARNGSVQYALKGHRDLLHWDQEYDDSAFRSWLTKTMGYDFTHDIVAVTFAKAMDADLAILSPPTPTPIPILVADNSAELTDAGLIHLRQASHIERIDLQNTRVTDAGLAHLAGLKQLRGLGLTRTRVSDSGLEHLKGLLQLQWLELNHTQITDKGLESVGALAKLEALSLNETRISNVGLARLRPLTHLRFLSLDATDVSQDGFEALQELTQLQELSLDRTRVSHAGQLARFLVHSPLRRLSLIKTEVADGGLEHIAGFARLESLDLSRTQVTDAGLRHLGKMTRLKGLKLRYNRITDAGLEHLKEIASLESVDVSSVSSDALEDFEEAIANRAREK